MIARSLPVLVLAVAVGCAGGPLQRLVNRSGDEADRVGALASAPGILTALGSQPVRVELTPSEKTGPLKSEQVLIATVYDADGQPAKRQKVEWHLDGPGHIVAVDEEGLLTSRGRRIDSQSAVSYTASSSRTRERGQDPKDDINVGPGQTWLLVMSAVEGLTTITATLPEAKDPEKSSGLARLTWSDSPFGFPGPVVSRPGGTAELLTTLGRDTGKGGEGDLRVRYRILDGSPAVLVSQTGDQLSEAVVTADARGNAPMRVVQSNPMPGRTRIAVEVVKTDPSSSGPGTVIGRQETSIEWAGADLTFEVQAPRVAAVESDVEFKIVVANVGKAASLPVTVRAVIPEGASLVRTDPPSRIGGDALWDLDAVSGGSTQTLRVVLRTASRGPLILAATAETADGMRAEHSAAVEVGSGAMKVSLAVPETAHVGESVGVIVAVNNPTQIPLENVTAWLSLDDGLTHASGANPVEVSIGTVPADETRRVEVPLTAAKSGRFNLRVNATADGGLTDRAQVELDARRMGLAVTFKGPQQLLVGERGEWFVTVTNIGDAAVADTAVRVAVPRALAALTASDGGTVAGTNGAEWHLGSLGAGESRELRLITAGDQPGTRVPVRVTATAGAETASADAVVTVTGQPALVLEVSAPPSNLRVGGKAPVRVMVRNRGSGPARKIEVALTASGGMRAVGGTGADRRAARADGDRVVFGVIDELPPGATAVYVGEVEGTKAGPARVQVEVRAEQLKQPLRDEQAGRVAGG